jgi:hypothetical protein
MKRGKMAAIRKAMRTFNRFIICSFKGSRIQGVQ